MKQKIKEILSAIKDWHIVVVGSGGTGSNLVPHLSQLIFSLTKENISMVLADEDVVEEKNIGRQFFVEADLGQNKARTLQMRYTTAWGVNISYLPHYITNDEMLIRLLKQNKKSMPILVGCVDNHKSRQIFHRVFEQMEDIIYLDAGNSEFAGQVVMGLKHQSQTLLEPVANFYPDILTSTDGISIGGTCSQQVIEVPQSLVANLWAATTLLSFINNIIGLKEVPVNMATFNAQNVVCKPEYIDSL